MSGNRIDDKSENEGNHDQSEIVNSIVGLVLLVFAVIWLIGWTSYTVPDSAWYKDALFIIEAAAAFMLFAACLVGIIVVGPERKEKERKA